ncbi:hypothetical protein BT96DRAFT_923674 [Gymnopus androsaceus JB14]|uniref:F-box domain-containing protein n=1 Tax=Gymnopus androsaceus JB14 TaxID=1447944 RepID=A0A6A4HAJ2_9AGAR|nr:hypothetical protein BT96DRAFT_923674 [Gymnopus androsaceus JB14]
MPSLAISYSITSFDSSPLAHSHSTMTQILPLDILLEITPHVDPIDVLNLSLTSKCIHHYIHPLLFHDIELRGLKRAFKIVQYLLLNPKRARTVRSLVIRPSYLRRTSKKRLAGEQHLSSCVERLAPKLHNLRKFVWDGIEIPASSMWASLRLGCPRLKEIGTNLGGEEIDPESELFAFSDLTSFSLTSEFHDNYLPFDIYNRNGEELPPALWTMLIDRSPRLQTLVLGDRGPTLHTTRTISVRPLIHARWPHLRSLSISDARICDFADFDPFKRKQFAAFIEAHHATLRHLSYSHFSYGYLGEDYQDPPLLERQGCDLRIQPTLVPLQEIALTGEAFCGGFLPLFKRYLGSQRELRKLEIWLDFSQSLQIDDNPLDVLESDEPKKPIVFDQLKELRELVESCPRGLESLKLLISTKNKETFYWRDIPQIIRQSTQAQTRKSLKLPQFQLKHLEVWKAYKSGEGELGNAAVQIALAENSPVPDSDLLETIVLVACFDQWGRSNRMKVLQHAKYRIHRRTVYDEEVAEWEASVAKRRRMTARISMMSPLLTSTGNGDHNAQVSEIVPRQTIVTLMATNEYQLELGALMGARRLMVKKKRAGKKVLTTYGGREWRVIQTDESVLRRGLTSGLRMLKRWIAPVNSKEDSEEDELQEHELEEELVSEGGNMKRNGSLSALLTALKTWSLPILGF